MIDLLSIKKAKYTWPVTKVYAELLINVFRSYMDGVSSLDIIDRLLILKHLCIDNGKLKWFENLEDLNFGCSVGLSEK